MPSSSDRDRRAMEELADDWRFASQSLFTPFTAGSEHAFPVAPFADAHYTQADTSLNKTLWDLWPVSPPDGYSKVLKHHEAMCEKQLPFNLKQDPREEGWFSAEKLPSALPHAERARIASNVRLIQELHTRLNAAGWLHFNTLAEGLSPLSILYTRKAMFDVVPLASAVETAKRLKTEGDVLKAKAHRVFSEKSSISDKGMQALAGAGIGKYCSALFSLWPWTASGLIMGPKVAFDSGLAQLESELWYNISEACIILKGHEQRRRATLHNGMAYEDTEGYYFVILGRLANFVPIHTRYVSYRTLQRAYHHATVFALMFETLIDLWCEEAPGGVILSERCCVGAGVSPDAWAHETCTTRHKGCMGLGFGQAAKKQARSKMILAKKEREAREAELADQGRWELIPSDAEEEEELTYDRNGKKTTGPKVEYEVAGGVHPL